MDWLIRLYGLGPGEWERAFTRTWFYTTPPVLLLATVIMAVLLTRHRRWTKRMSRASFGIISSCAIIMLRFLALDLANLDVLPQPWALVVWTYAMSTAIYFGYALLTEWAIPFARRSMSYITGGSDAAPEIDPDWNPGDPL